MSDTLLEMLKQERRKIAELEEKLNDTSQHGGGGGEGGGGGGGGEVKQQGEERVRETGEEGTEGEGGGEQEMAESRSKALKSGILYSNSAATVCLSVCLSVELSRARQEAFDQFRRSCPLMEQVTLHKTDLRTR